MGCTTGCLVLKFLHIANAVDTSSTLKTYMQVWITQNKKRKKPTLHSLSFLFIFPFYLDTLYGSDRSLTWQCLRKWYAGPRESKKGTPPTYMHQIR